MADLTPEQAHARLVDALTDMHINPGAPWPSLRVVAALRDFDVAFNRCVTELGLYQASRIVRREGRSSRG